MKIEVTKKTILKHREPLAFLDRKYPDKGPTQSDLVESLDPSVDMTQELEAMDMDTPEAALVEPPQGDELAQATQMPTEEGDLGQEEMEVADEDRVSTCN